jgi:hypothetical protein
MGAIAARELDCAGSRKDLELERIHSVTYAECGTNGYIHRMSKPFDGVY